MPSQAVGSVDQLCPAALVRRGLPLTEDDEYNAGDSTFTEALRILHADKRPLLDVIAEPFTGVGAYALFAVGKHDRPELDLIPDDVPCYVGKAIPKKAAGGYRLGRRRECETQSRSLYNRLREHVDSMLAAGLDLTKFQVAIVRTNGFYASAVEDFLIDWHLPIWNSSGFGLHATPNRAHQQKSNWDRVYPGRASRPEGGDTDPGPVLDEWIDHLLTQFHRPVALQETLL